MQSVFCGAEITNKQANKTENIWMRDLDFVVKKLEFSFKMVKIRGGKMGRLGGLGEWFKMGKFAGWPGTNSVFFFFFMK